MVRRDRDAKMIGDVRTILQVSPADIGGGAEKVARDLHTSYLLRDLDAWLAVGTKLSDDLRVIRVPNEESVPIWTRTLLTWAEAVSRGRDPHAKGPAWALDRALRFTANPAHLLRIQRGLEDFDFPGTARLLELSPRVPDVLHLHNLHGGYFDIRMLPELSRRVPTVLTMHDVWPLTGHCAYPMGCERWKTGCGDCPDLALPQPIRRDASAENARIKRAALTQGLLHVATPSRWLMGLVEKSGVAASLAGTRVIPNGVDTAVFRPGDRSEARSALGLDHEATVILFSARSAKSSPFKGFEVLEAALLLITSARPARNLVLLALGEAGTDASVAGIPVRFLPFTTDPLAVARHYQAADLYVHPARAESFGLSVLEAMACGTAVVAADTGGIPEIVVDGETGMLYPNDDPRLLSQAVTTLLGDPERRLQMGEAGAARARREFPQALQVDRYLDWYREIARTPVSEA